MKVYVWILKKMYRLTNLWQNILWNAQYLKLQYVEKHIRRTWNVRWTVPQKPAKWKTETCVFCTDVQSACSPGKTGVCDRSETHLCGGIKGPNWWFCRLRPTYRTHVHVTLLTTIFTNTFSFQIQCLVRRRVAATLTKNTSPSFSL